MKRRIEYFGIKHWYVGCFGCGFWIFALGWRILAQKGVCFGTVVLGKDDKATLGLEVLGVVRRSAWVRIVEKVLDVSLGLGH